LVHYFSKDKGIVVSKMLGSQGLKFKGKVFAMKNFIDFSAGSP